MESLSFLMFSQVSARYSVIKHYKSPKYALVLPECALGGLPSHYHSLP